MNASFDDSIQKPLTRVLAEIIVLWGVANVGYYTLIPALGFSISYDVSPIANAIYFGFWVLFCAYYFKPIYSRWSTFEMPIWFYLALSLGLAGFLYALVYLFSLMPAVGGPSLAPYTDILLATPWYFLPKAVEILLQQLLVAVLVLELFARFHRVKTVIVGYILCFVGAHVLQFLVSDTPAPYAIVMTSGAFLSSFLFPYLMIRVKGGFVYSFMLHFLFYLLIAMLLHAFPPPGYVF